MIPWKRTLKSNAAQKAVLRSLRAGLHFDSFSLSPRDSFQWHTRDDTFHNFLQLLGTIPSQELPKALLSIGLPLLHCSALNYISKVCSDKY